MTGTVFDIRRFSTHDGEGIRTTVFMKGCPLRCVWCHNPEGIDTRSRPLFFQDRCIGCGTCRRLAKEGGMRLVEGRLRLDVSKEEDWDGLIEACPAGAIVRDSRVMTAEQVAVEAMRDAPFYKYGGGGDLLWWGTVIAGRLCGGGPKGAEKKRDPYGHRDGAPCAVGGCRADRPFAGPDLCRSEAHGSCRAQKSYRGFQRTDQEEHGPGLIIKRSY